MIFDVNMYLGSYPFRKITNTTAPELVALMDKFGIAKGCVATLNGVFYHDVMDGNYELLEEIKGYEDRLVPFAVINPTYAEAKNDLVKCVEELGFKGIRLHPKHHFYNLTDPECVDLLKYCAEKKIPVHIPLQIEDLRQAHKLDVCTMVQPAEILEAAKLVPDVTIILSNAYLHAFAPALKECENIYYDIGRIDNLYQTSFNTVLDAVGVEKIVFGSGAPTNYIGVDLIKLMTLKDTNGMSDEDVEKIASGNLLKLVK